MKNPVDEQDSGTSRTMETGPATVSAAPSRSPCAEARPDSGGGGEGAERQEVGRPHWLLDRRDLVFLPRNMSRFGGA